MLAVLVNVFIFIVLPITIGMCIGCCIRYRKKRARRSVVTRVMSSNPSSRGATVVTLNQRHTPVASSNQVTSSFNFSAAVPYPQEPVYKDAQLSCQDAPPSYFEATAYPAIDAQQAAAQYPPNPVAAYPTHQSPVPYPQDVPFPNQAYPPPSQPIPQPDL
jgi:hypothetical protein